MRQNQNRGRGTYERPYIDYAETTDYFEEDNTYRKRLFVDWPMRTAEAFHRGVDKRSSLRRLFDHVTITRNQLRRKPEAQRPSIVREGMGKLRRFVEYQASRRIVSDQVKRFIDVHYKAVGDDPKRFEAFFQLFQGVMAYLPR